MPEEAVKKKTEKEQPSVALTDAKITKIPGVQLELSLGKEIVVRIPGVEQSYRGKIVGYDPYDYIIASVRLPNTVRKELNFGGQIIIKYILKGTVYGFKATVHNAITSPTSLIFFDYPDVIEKINLRRTSRDNCNIDATLHLVEGDDIECMVVNVSESGCKVSARAGTRDALKRTKVDDTMVISMGLGTFGMLKLPIAVRNIKLEKGIISLGCMFLDIEPKEVELLQKYKEKIQRLTR